MPPASPFSVWATTDVIHLRIHEHLIVIDKSAAHFRVNKIRLEKSVMDWCADFVFIDIGMLHIGCIPSWPTSEYPLNVGYDYSSMS